MLRPYTSLDAAQLSHVAPDFDPEPPQQPPAHGAAGDPRHSLPRARPLENIARVLTIVLQAASEIGVPGPGPGDLAPPLGPTGGVRLRRHHVLPVLPVAVPHQHRDR